MEAPPVARAPQEEEPLLLTEMVEEEEEIIDLTEVVEEEPARAEPVEDESPLTFEQAREQLDGVDDREAIARVVLRFSRSVFSRCLLFTVNRGMVIGWRARGKGIDPALFRNLYLPLNRPSVFQTVVETKSHYVGSLKKNRINIQFLGHIGRQIPRSAFVMPVLARGRVVNMLYGDNGHNQNCSTDIGELLILAQKISQSYEMIFQQKQAAFQAKNAKS
jgi:hypothetical protein